ncbi:hypothetical protein V1281_001723 [Nitrobacteraceae bacterium AZCC 2161]
MTSWKEERDRLVAQTLAFVREVAAAHPTKTQAAQPVPAVAVVIAPSESIPASSVVASQVISQKVISQVTAAQQIAPMATMPAKPTASPDISERAYITQRVAAFRARQGRMIEEREAYYEAVKAKIQTVLGNESRNGRL